MRSLPLKEWPEAHRNGWQAACRPGQRLSRGGAASHLAPVTQADLANRFGLYLDFLDRSGQLDLTAEAGALVAPDPIAAFIAELQDRVSSVTVSRTIYKVRRAAECIAPDHNFAWLAEIGKDLALLEQPKDKFDRVVLTERLVEVSLVSFWKVDFDAEARPLPRAFTARNALMVALLAACPIRLKNFTGLDIGKSFRKIGETWWIFLKDTKSKRPDHRPVPSFSPAPLNAISISIAPSCSVIRSVAKGATKATDRDAKNRRTSALPKLPPPYGSVVLAAP